MEVAKLSNSFSTGNGGGNFERYVQTVFLLTLLIDGFSPILEKQITQLDFQGKHLGYDTDDLIVTATGKMGPKILCQIKHDITITKRSLLFKEVINAAWSDFQKSIFNPETDKIVLATGILAKDTVFAFRYIYDQAISSGDEVDFIQRIQQSNYTSDAVREKFDVLKNTLALANGGIEPKEKKIWQFCKSFVLLVFDLDFQSSVNQMLILSLIKCHSTADAKNVWSRLSEFVGKCNQSAACIKLENVPDEIKELFSVEDFNRLPISPIQPLCPSELWVQLSLIGSWSEKNENDIKLVELITGLAYDILRPTLHQLSISFEPYIFCKDGTWKIRGRVEIFHLCEKCFSDQTVEKVFSVAEVILKQRNNRFDQDGQLSLFIPETGEFQNSAALRRGLVNGLCILLNSHLDLMVCSKHICEKCSYALIYNIFADCDWIRLASLNDILPLVAEISPKQFLVELEAYIQKFSTELIRLFPHSEENPLFNQHFIYGIIWSIEALAWKEEYLVSCIRCLGEMAKAMLPDKDKSKIATNAITNILLPWHPQTLASIQKQKNAVQGLRMDAPEVVWTVIMTLLPGATSVTGGTPKPKYILNVIPDGQVVSNKDIEELNRYYASIAVILADKDIEKLEDLAEYIDYFDEDSITTYLTEVLEHAVKWSDEKKFPLWNKLSNLKYYILLDQKDVGIPETQLYKMLCSTIEAITPQNHFVLYQRLYLANFDEYLLHEDDDVEDSWKKKEKKRREAIEVLYKEQGVVAVQAFGIAVNALHDVGDKLGQIILVEDISIIFQAVSTRKLSDTFLYSVIDGFVGKYGIQILATSLQPCDAELISDIFSHLRLTKELVDIAVHLLGEQKHLFWQKLIVPTVLRPNEIDIEYVSDQLLEAGRAVAAVNICGCVYGDLPVPAEKLHAILIKAATTESEERLDSHAVQTLIQKLQDMKEPNIKELSEVELIYLPWLGTFSSVQPRALICRLANDPDFFCELLQLYYKKRHEDVSAKNTPKISPAWAQRLSQLFLKFKAVPGIDWNGVFHEDAFMNWLKKVKTWAYENDRYEVAMHTVGNGLSYASTDDDGLFIEQVLCKTLNASDAEEIRVGYSLGLYNQRGVRFIDPEGKVERTLAQKYSKAAEKAEGLGYSRYSELLKRISERYIFEAEQNALLEHQDEEEYNN